VIRGIDSQEFFPDTSERVPGDVEGEESRRADPAVMSEPDQRSGESEVPDQLVGEGRLEGGELLIARRAMRWRDLKAPWQVRRPAEELLVEVVADAADRLRHQEPGRRGVQEPRDVCAPTAEDDQADCGACSNAAPNSQATVPDRERPPPVWRDQVRAGQIEVEPPTEDSGGESPERDLSNEASIAALSLPAAADDHDSGE
jgi:hypothetical protein